MSNDVRTFNRAFRSFSVSIRTGDSSKKKMSNHLTVNVPGDRTDTTIRLTLREARSLQSVLNEALD